MGLIKEILRNNSGVSVKNFAVLSGISLGVVAGISFIVLLFLDFFYTKKTLNINLATYALVIGAFEGMLAVLMGLKVWSEKYEKNK